MKIVITNKGLVEEAAFTLLGASSKRGDDSKIGMFGSGNKYALAFLLRNNYGVRIFSGHQEIKVDTQEQTFREKTFRVITINDKPTSITTETGPKWTFWQAIREIYSNALDEGDATIKYYKNLDKWKQHHDRTSIVISTRSQMNEMEMAEIMENFDHYFLPESMPYLYKGQGVEIYPGHDGVIYRKGIRAVSKERRQSIFRYNLENIDINESRLINYEWQAMRKVWKAIVMCDIPLVVTRFLQHCSNQDLWEHNDDMEGGPFGGAPILSKTWKKALRNYKVCPVKMAGHLEPKELARTKLVPNALYEIIVEQMGEEMDALAKHKKTEYRWKECKINANQALMLQDALEWLQRAGVNIDYPVQVVHFTQENQFGLAADNTIYLSRKAFDKGQHFIRKVIFEEQTHLEHKVEDETRAMQNLYLDKIMTLLEMQMGE